MDINDFKDKICANISEYGRSGDVDVVAAGSTMILAIKTMLLAHHNATQEHDSIDVVEECAANIAALAQMIGTSGAEKMRRMRIN